MMKKFMNAPETVTDEELMGLGLAFSDIVEVDGHLVISKDLKDADRVTIVTYGGSGHEPAQAGFVGKGMLDVQAVGDIFAAPSGQLVFEAMKLADKGHGVLLLTLNYAGDQLAGKQAMKLAKKAGLNFRQVVTGEEIQFDPNGEDNKRVWPVPLPCTILQPLQHGKARLWTRSLKLPSVMLTTWLPSPSSPPMPPIPRTICPSVIWARPTRWKWAQVSMVKAAVSVFPWHPPKIPLR